MEIVDNRKTIIDKCIEIGDILEIIDPDDHMNGYWIVGHNGDFVEEEEMKYSLVNLQTGAAVLSKDLDSALKYYFLGCDIRVVDTELHIVE